MAAREPQHRRRGWLRRMLHHVRRRPRFTVAALVFVALSGVLAVAGVRPALSLLLAFDIAAAMFLVATVEMFVRTPPDAMRSWARDQDQGRWGFLWSGVVVSVVALAALSIELRAGGGIREIALAGSSLFLSWLFMNTIFALHYAHAFYGDSGRTAKRLYFPDTEEPDYWDFAYFSTVIGMTFQVSDVQICDRSIRRVALAHSVIAFFFNVIIIALSVNVVAGRA